MISTTTQILHPSSYYVGYNVSQYFCKPNQTFPITVIVTNIDGKKCFETKVTIQIERKWLEKKQDKRGLVTFESHKETITQYITSSSDCKNPSVFKFEPNGKYGDYNFLFIVKDEKGRKNSCNLSFSVSGGYSQSVEERIRKTQFECDKLTLIPNKKQYQVGDKAEIFIISSIFPCFGTLVVDCEGIMELQHFEMKDSTEIVSFNIKEELVPNAFVDIYLNGHKYEKEFEGSDQIVPSPAYAYGGLEIEVSAQNHELHITTTPSETRVLPGKFHNKKKYNNKKNFFFFNY